MSYLQTVETVNEKIVMLENREQACHCCLETELREFSEVDGNYILVMPNK